ncbi:MAG: hypothetical protein Kow0047_25640 [Anaerolineae bacterium]
MSSDSSKVILSLKERREIEEYLNALLGEATSQEQQEEALSKLSEHGTAAIPALIARLRSANPQQRALLGQLAQRLPRDAAVSALKGVAGDLNRTGKERLSAMTILDQFLQEPLEASLFRGLGDPRSLAIESLEEALADIEGDPESMIEYVRQLEQQPEEVIAAIIDATHYVRHPLVPLLLAMVALGASPSITEAALQRLGSIRQPEALRALRALTKHLRPAANELAERAMRKLTLSGIEATAEEGPDWRALISPPDIFGQQVVWFIRAAAPGTPLLFITVLIQDRSRIRDTAGTVDPVQDALPRRAEPGQVHTVQLPPPGGIAFFVEAPFDAGRELVAQAIQWHQAHGQPLPVSYRYYHVPLWMQPHEDSSLVIPGEGSWRAEDTARLLHHPAFSAWTLSDPLLSAVMQPYAASDRLDWSDPKLQAIKEQAAHQLLSDAQLSALEIRLRSMAEWLVLAHERELASLALWTAAHLRDVPPSEHPFLSKLAQRSLTRAWQHIKATR